MWIYTRRKHVIHSVGPVYSSRNVEVKASQLASCYKRSLTLAAENDLRSIVSACMGSLPEMLPNNTSHTLRHSLRFLQAYTDIQSKMLPI